MWLLPLLTLPLLSAAASLEFYFQPSAALPDLGLLPSSTRATLSSAGPALLAPLSSSNTLKFSAVPPGSYLLTVYGRDHLFENLRVDVLAAKESEISSEKVTAWTTGRGNEWDHRGEVRGEGVSNDGDSVKISVQVLGGKSYYQKRESLSLMALLKNPMILLTIFASVMTFGVPYMMKNIDPETMKEFEEMQKSSKIGITSGTGSLTNRDLSSEFAAYIAGSGGSKK